MAGATISDVLQGSASFSPVVTQGLAGIGITSQEHINLFYLNAQGILDAGEPANYAAAVGNPGIVRFTEGAHSSPLSTAASAAATFEIQSQLAAFQATSGTVILITNGNVIQ